MGFPFAANAQPNAYYPSTGQHQPSQDFNPWAGVGVPYQQHQDPFYPQQATFNRSYAPTTLSTITETSTPGTLGSNRVPFGSPASLPSTNLSYYTPPPNVASGARLSYASDASAAATTSYRNHHLHPSGSLTAGQLRFPEPSTSNVDSGATISMDKPGKERNTLVAVNREPEEDAEGSRPPAYTPR